MFGSRGYHVMQNIHSHQINARSIFVNLFVCLDFNRIISSFPPTSLEIFWNLVVYFLC